MLKVVEVLSSSLSSVYENQRLMVVSFYSQVGRDGGDTGVGGVGGTTWGGWGGWGGWDYMGWVWWVDGYGGGVYKW